MPMHIQMDWLIDGWMGYNHTFPAATWAWKITILLLIHTWYLHNIRRVKYNHIIIVKWTNISSLIPAIHYYTSLFPADGVQKQSKSTKMVYNSLTKTNNNCCHNSLTKTNNKCCHLINVKLQPGPFSIGGGGHISPWNMAPGVHFPQGYIFLITLASQFTPTPKQTYSCGTCQESPHSPPIFMPFMIKQPELTSLVGVVGTGLRRCTDACFQIGYSIWAESTKTIPLISTCIVLLWLKKKKKWLDIHHL